MWVSLIDDNGEIELGSILFTLGSVKASHGPMSGPHGKTMPSMASWLPLSYLEI